MFDAYNAIRNKQHTSQATAGSEELFARRDMGWLNVPVILLHGTSSTALTDYDLLDNQFLYGFSVAIFKGRSKTDFGQGFYATSFLSQAKI